MRVGEIDPLGTQLLNGVVDRGPLRCGQVAAF
jgi:hypothetical protein